MASKHPSLSSSPPFPTDLLSETPLSLFLCDRCSMQSYLIYYHPTDESPPLCTFRPTVSAIHAHTEKAPQHPQCTSCTTTLRANKDVITARVGTVETLRAEQQDKRLMAMVTEVAAAMWVWPRRCNASCPHNFLIRLSVSFWNQNCL